MAKKKKKSIQNQSEANKHSLKQTWVGHYWEVLHWMLGKEQIVVHSLKLNVCDAILHTLICA